MKWPPLLQGRARIQLFNNRILANTKRSAPNVIEQSQQDDHQRGDEIEIEHNDGQRHEEHNAYGLRDAEDRLALHALESDACLFDGVVDDR